MNHRFAIQQTAPLLHYLLRAMVRRINRRAMTASRLRDLEKEVTENLHPLVVSSRNTLQFVKAFSHRFEVNLSGGVFTGGDGNDHTAAPLYLLVPRCYVGHAGLPEMKHSKAAEMPDHACFRWDVACLGIDFRALRILINDGPAGFATFAFASDDPSDALLFEVPDPAVRDVPPFRAKLPERLLTPRAYRTVWTLTSNLAHGGDFKTGNVVLFRRERKTDPTTGEQHLVPLYSGGATRGLLRDIAGTLLCRSVGVRATDLPPRVANALFSGGTIEAGADNASVNVGFRAQLRALLPMWDVFGGVWNQQIMQGVLKMHDPIIVCRETAWLAYDRFRPCQEDGTPQSLEDFRASLPFADDITQLRLGTRMAHKDFGDTEGIQMLWNTELLLAGTQVAHSFQLQRLDEVSPVSASFVAHMMDEFRNVALIGAGSARGTGQVAFDPYLPAEGEEPLPSPSIFLEWMEPRKEAVLELLMGSASAGEADDGEGGPAAEPKAKRGRGKKAPAEVAAT